MLWYGWHHSDLQCFVPCSFSTGKQSHSLGYVGWQLWLSHVRPGPLPSHSAGSWKVAVCSSQAKLPEGLAKRQLSIWTNLKLKKCVKFHEKRRQRERILQVIPNYIYTWIPCKTVHQDKARDCSLVIGNKTVKELKAVKKNHFLKGKIDFEGGVPTLLKEDYEKMKAFNSAWKTGYDLWMVTFQSYRSWTPGCKKDDTGETARHKRKTVFFSWT